MVKHKIANNVVETYYNEFASTAERNGMLQEFCGPEFRHFKEPEVKSVKDLIAKHPEKEKYIIRHLAEHVPTLINKGCYNHSIVHTVIYNCLQVCGPKERTGLIEQLRDVCMHVLHSHDGARLTMNCFWHGTSKDRKAIIKTFKSYVKKICMEEHGYLSLLALFDTVDDTKLVAKAVLQEIIDNLEEIISNDHGKKVVMYVLAPRNKTYFSPDVITLLEQGDNNEHSKKDTDIRRNELKAVLSGPVCKYVLEHFKDMLFDNPATILLACVINHALPELTEDLMKELAEEASKPFFPGDDEPNVVENTATHILLKKIIAQDKIRFEKGVKTFSEIVFDTLDKDALAAWISCNRGAFLLVNMIETNIESVKQTVTEKLSEFKKTLKKQDSKGAMLLKQKLQFK